MKVRFLPHNVEFEIAPNQSVMNLGQEHGIYIKSVCKGLPSCAECRVRIVEGEHNVLPPSSAELALIGTAYFVDRRRLSCQVRCFGDITVDLTEQEEKRTNVGKRPRGKGPRDAAESYAVRGNMIDEQDKAPVTAPSSLESDEDEEENAAAPTVARKEGAAKRKRRRKRKRRGPGGSSTPAPGAPHA